MPELEQRFKNVFGSAEGRAVLGHILTLGHFGVTLDADNRDQVAEYNFAIVIATMAGALEPVDRQLGIIREE